MNRVCAAATVVCALMLPATASGYASVVKPDAVGINGQFLVEASDNFPRPESENPPQSTDAVVEKMAAAGVQVVRVPVGWTRFEPNGPNWLTGQHTTYFGGGGPASAPNLDAVVTALANHNIRMAPIIQTTPPWARQVGGANTIHTVPANDADYAWFVKAVALRYGNGGSFWNTYNGTDRPVQTYEIWNEENDAGFFTHLTGMCGALWSPAQQPGPQRYASLFAAAYWALKNHDQQAKVVVGGLTAQHWSHGLTHDGHCTPAEFLTGMKQNMSGAVVPDAIGLHIYYGSTSAGVEVMNPTPAEVQNRLIAVRQSIDNLGWSSVPIVLNENGWGTPGSVDTTRGPKLAAMADDVLRSNCNVSQYMPHTWRSAEREVADPNDWPGVAEANGDLHDSDVVWSDKILELHGLGTAAGEDAYTNMCTWRGAADIDGDGINEPEDTSWP